VSFSAGIEKKNFPAAVACGMVPVTTCTDLLRQGGYGRLPRYLSGLAEEMRRAGVRSREAYVLAAHANGAQAAEETLRAVQGGTEVWNREGARLTAIARENPDALPLALRGAATAAGLDTEAIVLQATRVAGRLNGRTIVPALADDVRYHAQSNRKEPRRIDSRLDLYDCINCDLCIFACPNDAIFAYDARPVEVETEQFSLGPQGEIERAPGQGFRIRKTHQLAVVEGACNECSNCEVYCPEEGAPFKLKEQVFLTLDDFKSSPSLDGFCREDNTLYARQGGVEMQLVPEPEHNRAVVHGERFRLELRWEPFEVRGGQAVGSEKVKLDTSLLWRMKTVWESIFNASKPNMVNPDPVLRRTETTEGAGISAGDQAWR
jgi:putative selenate reductase